MIRKWKVRGNQHEMTQTDIESVVGVLQSEWLTQGPQTELLETALQKLTSARFAIVVSSATAALHLSCLALGLRRGDVAWTVPNSFVASANCILFCGAAVDFVDIDLRERTISLEALDRKLREAAISGTLPRLIIPVHHGGKSCQMRDLQNLCAKYEVQVLEDASHALGSKYSGNQVGSCEFSDVAVFSLHPAKGVTSGEGGVILTNRVEIAEKIRRLRSHGIIRSEDANDHEEANFSEPGIKLYEQVDLGFNYRLPDVGAALALSQLDRLSTMVAKRRHVCRMYQELLGGNSEHLILPDPQEHESSSCHLFVVQFINDSGLRDKVFAQLRRNGIEINLHYPPIHLHPYFQSLGFKVGQFPNSERYSRVSMSVPIHSLLTDHEVHTVSKELGNALRVIVEPNSRGDRHP